MFRSRLNNESINGDHEVFSGGGTQSASDFGLKNRSWKCDGYDLSTAVRETGKANRVDNREFDFRVTVILQ